MPLLGWQVSRAAWCLLLCLSLPPGDSVRDSVLGVLYERLASEKGATS